jgi:NADH-quinone oxidoreductase subunit F
MFLVSHPDEVKVISQRFGKGAEQIDKYIELEGYEQARRASTMTPDAIIAEVKASNLRGRGGAGFPTGLKWSFVPKQSERPKYILVNGDESEPATCKDRPICQYDPHSVIEGTIIAGLAVGAKMGFIYMRGEYRYLLDIMDKCIADAYAKGFLGNFRRRRPGFRLHHADRRGRIRGRRRVGTHGVARRQARYSAHPPALPCGCRSLRRPDCH